MPQLDNVRRARDATKDRRHRRTPTAGSRTGTQRRTAPATKVSNDGGKPRFDGETNKQRAGNTQLGHELMRSWRCDGVTYSLTRALYGSH